jgi:putative transposase
MPRKARIDAPGALHHIICRGIERRKIFVDDTDRDEFIRRLAGVVNETQTFCYAWALIPNHFHLLLRTGGALITTVMQRLLSGYAGAFNRRHRRTGHLFHNRYKSILCQEDAYLLELTRYIHLNPLRARIVKSLDDLDFYPFTGHSALMGTLPNDWQETDRISACLGSCVQRPGGVSIIR